MLRNIKKTGIIALVPVFKLMGKRELDSRAFRFFGNRAKKIKANARLIVLLLSCFAFLSAVTCISFLSESGAARVDLNDFEVGAVADRDVTLSSDLIYIDEAATAIRREARMNLVTAVFEYLPDSSARSRWQLDFFDFLRSLEEASLSPSSPRTSALEVQNLYPGSVSESLLEEFFSLEEGSRSETLRFASYFFNSVVARGLTSFPDEGMENFSRTEVEVVRNGERVAMERSALLTRESLDGFLDSEAQAAGLAPSLKAYVSAFVFPFLRENLVYQRDESERKLSIALDSVSPVLVVIPQGEQIVRRGFVVTEESYARLERLAAAGGAINIARLAAAELLLAAVIFISVFVLSAASCKNLGLLRYRVFLAVCFCIVYALGIAFTHVHALQNPLNFMVSVPTAFFSILIVILLGKPVAVGMVFSMSVAVFASSGFSPEPMLFSVFSGIAAVAVTRDTGHRLDLVRSAGFMLLLCAAFTVIIAIVYPVQSSRLLPYIVMAALNGFLSGILVIGLLPLLEKLLNAVTSFRLMELSDLNTPLMQKMLLTVPGTYNHSQMVASLSEEACRAIGANALLARVGAYYHDIGKMDQGEYFVENQHGENKHEWLPPRISATIIRSHVKQGLEKARNLKLPDEVTAFIEEHHGNSVISYFYNKAKLENPDTDPEDFMYPGNPPKTRESAVVMLADTVEAACRTLEKPSMPRLEKFIDELVRSKIEHGQLNDCDLTFRDLDTIKKSFVSLLVGYYHSRIEYPDQKDPDESEKAHEKEEASADEALAGQANLEENTNGGHAVQEAAGKPLDAAPEKDAALHGKEKPPPAGKKSAAKRANKTLAKPSSRKSSKEKKAVAAEASAGERKSAE